MNTDPIRLISNDEMIFAMRDLHLESVRKRPTSNIIRNMKNNGTSINIYDSIVKLNVTTSIPSSVFDLKHIKHLKINGKLTSLPEKIFDLNNLEYLDLSGNRLTSLPESLGKMKNMKKIRPPSIFHDDNQNFNKEQNGSKKF